MAQIIPIGAIPVTALMAAIVKRLTVTAAL